VCCVYVWVSDCAVLPKKKNRRAEMIFFFCLFITLDCWKSWEHISLSPFPTIVICFKDRFYKQCSVVTKCMANLQL